MKSDFCPFSRYEEALQTVTALERLSFELYVSIEMRQVEAFERCAIAEHIVCVVEPRSLESREIDLLKAPASIEHVAHRVDG